MKNVISTAIVTIVVMIVLITLAAGAFARTGIVNVAASADYLPGAEWFFGTLSESSIRKHARAAVEDGTITPPAEITPAMIANGRHHYVEMCVVCHGAPGVERGEIGRGQKPLPPELSHAAEEFTISEIYWVIEHGIRHTGMPAYGETHSPDEIWGLAAFVEQLETMTPEEYARQTKPPEPANTEAAAPEGDAGDGHSGHTH